MLSLCLASCSGSGLFLVNLLARFGSYDLESDLAYGESPAQRLDAYVPRGVERPPVVLFFHGGSWTNGHKEDYRFVGDALASRGMLALVVGYRRFPDVRFPEFMDDVAKAVVWAHAKADGLGGNPDQIFIMGHSSGAHMAVLGALDVSYLERAGGRPEWLRGAIGLSGPYDFKPRGLDASAVFENISDADLPTTQPLHYAGRARMPLLLMHGEADQFVQRKNTVNLAAAVQRAGGEAKTIFYPEIDHEGMIATFSRPLRGSASALDDVASFVRARIGGSS